MAVKQVVAKIKKKLGMEDDGEDDDDGGANKDPRKGITIHPFFEFPKIELVCTRNPIPGQASRLNTSRAPLRFI